MVAGFLRSFSFSGPNPCSPARAKGAVPEKSLHIRSASLPCRSHPIISQVEDAIRVLKVWNSQPECESTASLCAGLALLELLYTSVNDLIQLPQSQESLCCRSPWTERLLHDFLYLADTYGNFRSAIMLLKEHQLAAEVAIRRSDEAGLISCVKSLRNIEKELVKFSSSLRNVSRQIPSTTTLTSNVGETELAGIMREVTSVTVSTSASIFFGVSSVASSTTSTLAAFSSSSRDSWIVCSLKRLSSSPKKKAPKSGSTVALQWMEKLEECLGAIERKSERMFRSLVNTRVALLNALTL